MFSYNTISFQGAIQTASLDQVAQKGCAGLPWNFFQHLTGPQT